MAQANLKLEMLDPMEIPLPSLTEQKSIAACLTEQMQAVDKLQAGLSAQLEEINALIPALLRRAFAGEL
jgi:type I restriction enzyme S subunit